MTTSYPKITNTLRGKTAADREWEMRGRELLGTLTLPELAATFRTPDLSLNNLAAWKFDHAPLVSASNTPLNAGRWVSAYKVGPLLSLWWGWENLTEEERATRYLNEVFPYPSFVCYGASMRDALNRDEGFTRRVGPISQDDALYLLATRVLLETEVGFITEHDALVALRQQDPTLRRATDHEDADYHLDLVGENIAFQIKPESFLRRQSNPTVAYAVRENLHGQARYEAETGNPVRYLSRANISFGNYDGYTLTQVAAMTGETGYLAVLRHLLATPGAVILANANHPATFLLPDSRQAVWLIDGFQKGRPCYGLRETLNAAHEWGCRTGITPLVAHTDSSTGEVLLMTVREAGVYAGLTPRTPEPLTVA